ncbi:MAG: hypothetical protein JO112_21620, partial [Planctomycetes bacterium]|nr:hypothetical protein [Planctomycetota bacterium]
CLAFTPDGRQVISGSDDSTLRLWDVATAREQRCLQGHEDSVTSVAVAADGRGLLSGSSDRTARWWDLAEGREVHCLTGHANWVNCVALSPDGTRALTGSGGEVRDGHFQDGPDLTVRLWDLSQGCELSRFEGHQASVTSVVFAPGSPLALSGSLDMTVRLLRLPG